MRNIQIEAAVGDQSSACNTNSYIHVQERTLYRDVHNPLWCDGEELLGHLGACRVDCNPKEVANPQKYCCWAVVTRWQIWKLNYVEKLCATKILILRINAIVNIIIFGKNLTAAHYKWSIKRTKYVAQKYKHLECAFLYWSVVVI